MAADEPPTHIRAISRQAAATITYLSMEEGPQSGWRTRYHAEVQPFATNTGSELLLGLMLHGRRTWDYQDWEQTIRDDSIARLRIGTTYMPRRLRIYRSQLARDGHGATPRPVFERVVNMHDRRFLLRCEVLDIELTAIANGVEVPSHPDSVAAVYLPFHARFPMWVCFFRAPNLLHTPGGPDLMRVEWDYPRPVGAEQQEQPEEQDEEEEEDEQDEQDEQEEEQQEEQEVGQ